MIKYMDADAEYCGFGAPVHLDILLAFLCHGNSGPIRLPQVMSSSVAQCALYTLPKDFRPI